MWNQLVAKAQAPWGCDSLTWGLWKEVWGLAPVTWRPQALSPPPEPLHSFLVGRKRGRCSPVSGP